MTRRTSTWYLTSAKLIAWAIVQGGTPEEKRARADAAYPFGQRAYWPYKCWLAARADLFAEHGLATPQEIAERERRAAAPAGIRTIRPHQAPQPVVIIGEQQTLF